MLNESFSPTATCKAKKALIDPGTEFMPSVTWQRLFSGYLSVVTELLRNCEDDALTKLLNEVRWGRRMLK